MSSAEKRQELHNYIDQLDEASLEALYTILETHTSNKISLTEAEKKAIDDGLASIEQGNTYTHEEVMNEMKEKYPNLYKK